MGIVLISLCGDANTLASAGGCIFQFGILNNAFLFFIVILALFCYMIFKYNLPTAVALPVGGAVVYMLATMYPDNAILNSLLILWIVAIAVLTVLMVIKYGK